jgi:DNA (cytosine-5)-methyltransferase 1
MLVLLANIGPDGWFGRTSPASFQAKEDEILRAFWEILSGRHIVAPAEGWQNSGIVPGIESGYGLAWRVLDAQYLGVPQRRRRVFVVGHLGDWRRAAAVLFERQSLRGDSPPSRKAGQRIAPAVTSGAANGSAGHGARSGSAKEGLIEVVSTMSESSGHARPGDNIQSVDYLIPAVANPLTARMHKGVNTTMDEGQTMVLAFDTTQLTHPANHSAPKPGDPHPLAAGAHVPAIAFDCKRGGDVAEVSPPLRAMNESDTHANGGGQVAVAFKPSHFTRDKDGAPSEVVPPLSADADKGDQDTLVAVGRSGDIAATLQGSVGGNGNAGNGSEAIVAIAYDDRNQAAASDVHHTLRGDGVGSRVGDAVAFESRFARNGRGAPSEVVPPLKAQPGQTGKGDAAPLVVALHENQRSETHESDTLQALNSGGGKPGQGYPAIRYDMQVRRLTPRECERLQGFPDDYTLIQNRGKPAADGPRYKALGNSMAVPVMRWIGERIQEVDKLGCVTEQRRAGDEQ